MPKPPPVSPAREAAFRILHRVETEGSFASYLLASSSFDRLVGEDRRLLHELVMGTLRWQGQLDHVIERYSTHPVKKLDLPVLLAMRLGVYQVRFLRRIPHWAAINESVQLVKNHGVSSASGLVNAVLRQAWRDREGPVGEDLVDEREQLSVKFSHPRWLVKKWVERLGPEDASSLMKADNTTPPTALWLNPLREQTTGTVSDLLQEGVKIAPSPVAQGAWRVASGTLNARSLLVRQGRVYIQDEASQLMASILDVSPGFRVLDLCAAPGGKTSYLAAQMGNEGMIVAGDRHFHRLSFLNETCRRLGATIVSPVLLDGTVTLPLFPPESFDRILVDAPCSGTGTLRRHPEIKWRLTPEEIGDLADAQFKLLKSAAQFLAPGGRLVYATCSLEPEENEHVVNRFLADAGTLALLFPSIHQSLVSPDGFVRTFPHLHDCDGFFGAVLGNP